MLQASPTWSRDHLEEAPDTVVVALLAALEDRAEGPLPPPVHVQAHRWRYARSATGSDLALWSEAGRLGCCGDWLAGPRVECAWDSGETLARRMTGRAGT